MEATLSADSAPPKHHSHFHTVLAKPRRTETQAKKLTDLWTDEEIIDGPTKSPGTMKVQNGGLLTKFSSTLRTHREARKFHHSESHFMFCFLNKYIF